MDQFVIVIEDDEKMQDSLFKVLKKINPILKLRFFDKLESFSSWITLVIKDGPIALETAGFRYKDDTDVETVDSEKRLNLIICKQEIMGSHFVALAGKSIDLFLRKKMCSEEEKTSIVMTAFDHVQFDLKSVEVKFINNVIYKPFDNLILEEHLRYAVIGRKKPKDENLKSNKLSAQIEMVKDIPVAGFSDTGFITVSDRPIKTGEISKYYANEFLAGTSKSTMAKCVKSEQDPQNKNNYLCWMEYFALDNEQIKKFRKDMSVEFPNNLIVSPKVPLDWNVVFFDSYADHEFVSSFKRTYPQSTIFSYSKWEDFEFDYNPEKSEMLVEKDLPADNDFKIFLDPTGHFFLDHDEIPEGEVLFGENKNTIKSKDFQSLLTPDSKKKWQDLFKNQKVDLGAEPTLVVLNNNKKYIFKLISFIRGVTSNQMPCLELKIMKLANFEKIDFLKTLSPLKKNIDLVFGSESFLKNCIKKNYYEKENKILIAKNSLSDNDEKYWAQYVKDIFFIPIDRQYLVKKIYFVFLDVRQWDQNQFLIRSKEIQSAQQIQLDEVSEAGLFFKYHRPLEIGSFRRFYLWTPDETQLLDYHANCNYTEEIKEQKGTFFHHFVFFGMKDLYLKNIRLWVRENYILNKSKND